ncbi:IucA/IucC family protein [Cohnella cellulosilytica]|uniref:IucA/IucC family protein n=1 Tax=Cohnella cellulosilytica TaxID=986710 RepID=A0ABW2FI10_9BACL
MLQTEQRKRPGKALQTNRIGSAGAEELALRATLRALLNCYFREKGIADPRTEKREGMGPSEPGETFAISWDSGGGITVEGTLAYSSRIGQHDYGPAFEEIGPDGTRRPLSSERLIALLLEDASRSGPPDSRAANLIAVGERVENSLRNMGRYIDQAWRRESGEDAPLDFIRSEQSLLCGHPFHPYPKSSEGFAEDELGRYSPELGASFRLCYIAVHRRYVSEEWAGEEMQIPPSDAAALARERLGGRAEEYALLPMHPWQMAFLLRQPGLQELIGRSEIVDLGPAGPVVYPTSSVRTVWDPDTGDGYKLPLHVRITNLVRDNTPEQARRTLDAARIVRRLGDEPGGEGFVILAETGCSQVSFETEAAAEWSAGFTVIHRPLHFPKETTFVLASLLEPTPGQKEPKLANAVRHGSGGTLPDWSEWLERYLELSLLPLLRLAAERGVGFEAHLQNSLLTLKQGWPDRFYVRDLEGVSVDRRKAAEAGWTGSLVDENSPVLYEAAEVWHRTKYYFVVNHLGSLIHAIAAYAGEDERVYWAVVSRLLRRERQRSSGRLGELIDDLLGGDTLPAKANLMSCMAGRGETPLFVPIPNPIKETRIHD